MAINVNNNSNAAALIALQNLNNTQTQLTRTQDTVASGLAVSSAQDDPAVWAMAQGQQLQISGLDAVTQSLNRATSISDLATAAGQAVVNILNRLKQDALSATETSLDPAARQSYNDDFKSLLNQITQTVNNASFDGANLLDGSSSGNVAVLASADGSSFFTLSGTDLSLGGSVITVGTTASLGSSTAAASALSQINTSLANVAQALANLGTQASQISAHALFVGTLSDTLQTGVGNLVNANMGAESARLQALQIQQQLGAQALSIANQAPSAILSLFR
jgi:flagellin